MNRFLLFLWSITNYAMQLTRTYVRFGFGSFVFCARSGVGETDCERADREVGVAPYDTSVVRATRYSSMRTGATHLLLLWPPRTATGPTAHAVGRSGEI